MPTLRSVIQPTCLLIFGLQDDGTPDQYDLPPPSADGVVPLFKVSEDGKTSANVGMSVDEKAQWEEKVGWAPRFGQGSITEVEAAESLLDHQTFLESKLDDKFYGGEVTHFVRKSIPC